jgi:hypothetical protein
VLRPRLRLRLPDTYAQYDYDRAFVRRDEAKPEWEEFERIREVLHVSRRDFEDPARLHPLHRLEELQPYLSPTQADEIVDWKAWTKIVAEYEVRPGERRPITRTSAMSYYAAWQRLRAWALLERQTLHMLVDPRGGVLDEIRRSWNYDLNGRWMMSQWGDGRYERLLQLLEADGWLGALYRSKALSDWADIRTWRPEYQLDADAARLTTDERWAAERTRLIQRCEMLAQHWVDLDEVDELWPRTGRGEVVGIVPAAYRRRVRALLELWAKASEDGHAALAAALREDLEAASTWAIFAFDSTFVSNDAQVGELAYHHGVSLGAVLRPERTKSRRNIDQHATHFTSAFNQHIAEPQLADGDLSRFLDFLEQHEMWAWTMELSNFFDDREGSSDTARDRRFLHLRSLALFIEQVLAVLAETHGTKSDRDNIGQSGMKRPLKVFLADRHDWRKDLWALVATNEYLTKTNDASSNAAPWVLADSPPVRLSKCIAAIVGLEATQTFAGAAKQLLILWALRNFGAHRFSRDAHLLDEFGPHFTGAVLFCPLLYWKIATTMA